MNYKELYKYIAFHAGANENDNLDNFCFFVDLCNFGDASDDILTATVRYINPKDENDWAYDIFVLSNVKQSSLIYWEIELVYSTNKNIYFKTSLIPK